MQNKTKLIISSLILLLLTYFLFLGIFSSFSQSQKLGEILNSDSTLYNLQSDGYSKDSLPDSVRCIGAENTYLELLTANFKYNNTDNFSIAECNKYHDTILFYNNVKDNLKIDIDLANYDMTEFKNNYPGKTIFPIIISSSLKDKYKIGDEYFKFDFTKAYKPTKISFVIVGYNDYLYNSAIYETSNDLFAVVNQVDYAKLQSYIGIYSMYTTENKSESFKDLKSYLDSYNIKMNFDDTSTYFINGSNSWNNLIKSSMKLNNVINYNDATSNDVTYLVGKKP